MEKEEMERKVEEAIARKYASDGFEILARRACDEMGCFSLVAKTEDLLAFVTIAFSEGDSLPSPDACRGRRDEAERSAIRWLRQHPEATDVMVRFDNVDAIILAEDWFLYRHHVNWFCGDDSAD